MVNRGANTAKAWDASVPEITITRMLRRRARETPNRLALRQKDFGIWNPVTWSDYWHRTETLALGLRKLGLAADGHLAIVSENRQEWVLAQFATFAAGARVVGVYPTSPAPEVAYILNHSDAEFVVCEDQEQTDKVLEIAGQLPCLRKILVVDMKGLRAYDDSRIMALSDVEALGSGEDPEPVAATVEAQKLDDTALIIYTSGSTGRPKGAMISYRNLRAEAVAVMERLGEDSRTTHLSYLPLCHIAEQIFTTMGPVYAGGVVNFGESLRTVQEDLREIAPTSFLGVPRIWEKLHSAIHIKMIEAGGWRKRLFDAGLRTCRPFAEVPRARRTWRQRTAALFYHIVLFRALLNYIGLSHCKVAMTGAAPVAPEIVTFFRTIGVPLVEVYGQTETTGIVTGQYPGHVVPGAVGPPTINAETHIDADTGELCVRGDLVFQGYYKNDDATRQTIVDGWLRSGDVVEDREGQIRIVDRLKDIMITAGGKNLSPSEIENTAKASPYIKECIVVGEGRKYVAALIQIDLETVGKWAEENQVPFTNYKSLAQRPEIRHLVDGEIDTANAELPRVAQIRRFHILTKELDHDDDEVTATMKVRRSKIWDKYRQEIEALYQDEAA